MMLELSKKDATTLRIKFHYDIPYGKSWWSGFDHHCSSEHEAELMYGLLQDVMRTEVEKIRRVAYEQGWKDKSSKKPKQDWFSIQL